MIPNKISKFINLQKKIINKIFKKNKIIKTKNYLKGRKSAIIILLKRILKISSNKLIIKSIFRKINMRIKF